MWIYLPVQRPGGYDLGIEGSLSGPALPELGPDGAPHLSAVPHIAKLRHGAYGTCLNLYQLMLIAQIKV